MKSKCLAVLFGSMLALMPLTAGAATIGGEVFGSFNTYGMEDVNDGLPTGADEIKSGIGGGLGLRMWPTGTWMLQGTWEPLFAETEDGGDVLNVDGNSFQAGVAYFFPSTGNARYGLGAGVGYYMINGEFEDDGPPATTTDIEGNGVGFHVMGHGEWTVSPGFAITAGAGYRFADVEVDDVTPEVTVDYSGFMGRVGLAFYLPTGSGN
jgi:hypothetical protein